MQKRFYLRTIAKLRVQLLHTGRVIRRFYPEAAFFICRRQLFCGAHLLRRVERLSRGQVLLRRTECACFPAAGRRLRLRKRQLQRLLCGQAKRFAAQRVFPRLYNQIAIAAAKPRSTAAVCLEDCRRKNFRRVDNAERHLRASRRPAIRFAHKHRKCPNGRIARRLVQKRYRAVCRDNRIVCRGSSEAAAVHQKRAAGRTGKPAAVKFRLRLARAEIVPRAVAERLAPGVVIIAVRPAGRIHLPRRNPGCSQRVDRERGFLAAAPKA